MPNVEPVTVNVYGMYRDVLRDARERVIWESGWRKNTIVTSCRLLLASFMRGGSPPLSQGTQGLQVGMGLDAWDRPPGLPLPDPGRTSLVDPHPYTLDLSHIKIDYLDGANISNNPLDS